MKYRILMFVVLILALVGLAAVLDVAGQATTAPRPVSAPASNDNDTMKNLKIP